MMFQLLFIFLSISLFLSPLKTEIYNASPDQTPALTSHHQTQDTDRCFEAIIQAIRECFKKKNTDPHANVIAHITSGYEIDPFETSVLMLRQSIVESTLLNLLTPRPQMLRNIPRIAVIGSGGGYRAMIAFLGLVSGLDQIGLLNATTYMAGLSGSTWLIAPWIIRNVPIATMRQIISQKVQRTFGLHKLSIEKIAALALKKFSYDQPVGLVDIWGALIADNLMDDLKDGGLSVTMSDGIPCVAQAKFPFPICVSVAGNTSPCAWLEHTPGCVSSRELNACIPTWALGRVFGDDGASKDFPPEFALAYSLGIFGSAFNFNLDYILERLRERSNDPVVDRLLKVLINENLITDHRISPAVIPTFAQEMSSVVDDRHHLDLIDAGIDFNIPFPPVLHPARKVNIIIVCDASGGTAPISEMEKAAIYAKQYGLPFPDISTPTFATPAMKIFGDGSSATPIIIYFRNPENDYSTLKLEYSAAEFENICGAMEHAVMQNRDALIGIIRSML